MGLQSYPIFYSLNVKKDLSLTETDCTAANEYEEITLISDCETTLETSRTEGV